MAAWRLTDAVYLAFSREAASPASEQGSAALTALFDRGLRAAYHRGPWVARQLLHRGPAVAKPGTGGGGQIAQSLSSCRIERHLTS